MNTMNIASEPGSVVQSQVLARGAGVAHKSTAEVACPRSMVRLIEDRLQLAQMQQLWQADWQGSEESWESWHSLWRQLGVHGFFAHRWAV